MCSELAEKALDALEKHLWTGSYYRNFVEPNGKNRSDLLFAYQLDGQWITDHHGLPSALPKNRVQKVLERIAEYNMRLSRSGATNYAMPDGSPASVGGYGTYSYFPPEGLMLAMTYIYNGHRALGMRLAKKIWYNIVCRHRYTWDMPNIIRGDRDTGERTFGHDYYQDMMLWCLPPALQGAHFGRPCREGGLVDRVVKAARDSRPF